MRNSVRLIGMTAPVHDAEDLLSEFSIDKYVGFVEGIDPDVSGWAAVDLSLLIECDPRHTTELRKQMPGRLVAIGLSGNPRFEPDTALFVVPMTDLADLFISAVTDQMSDTVREILGVIYDMVSVDFGDVFETNPREVDVPA